MTLKTHIAPQERAIRMVKESSLAEYLNPTLDRSVEVRLEILKGEAINALDQLRTMEGGQFGIYSQDAAAEVARGLQESVHGARHSIGDARTVRILRVGVQSRFSLLDEAIEITERILLNLDAELTSLHAMRNLQMATISAFVSGISAVLAFVSAAIATIALLVQLKVY